MNVKEKAKQVWEDHKGEFIAAGAVVAGVGYLAFGYKMYKAGYTDGWNYGFHGTIEWFEKHFPEAGTKALYEAWMEANPDKLVSQKGLGKWG
jgi:hypothetical protein